MFAVMDRGCMTLLTSRPAQKPRPSPWITTARTPELSAIRESAVAWMDLNISMSSALSFSGRESTTSTTPSAPFVTRTRSEEAFDESRRNEPARLAGVATRPARRKAAAVITKR